MKEVLFIIWMLLTFVLSISIIGWIILLADVSTGKKFTWMCIGHSMCDNLLQK